MILDLFRRFFTARACAAALFYGFYRGPLLMALALSRNCLENGKKQREHNFSWLFPCFLNGFGGKFGCFNGHGA